jgi:hypothetical protein
MQPEESNTESSVVESLSEFNLTADSLASEIEMYNKQSERIR